jgi:tol-pal system protein YbgF
LERKVATLRAGGGEAAAPIAESGGGNLFSLYQDIQALQREVRELRGQIEELQYQAKRREQGQRDLYQDLDRRLRTLEQEVGIAPDAADAASADEDGDAAASDGDRAGDGDSKAVEQTYLAAFDTLQQGKQKAAIDEFEAFVKAHPDSEYSDNAWYWLGEAHYVDRSYDKAATAFRRVLSDFPNSDKAPGALYKIAVVQDERGDYQRARKTLRDVIDTYPEDNAAELARKRLQALEENSGQ